MKSTTSFLFSTTVFVLTVFAVGVIVSIVLAGRIDRIQRDQLLVQAKQAALLVTPTEISSLAGSPKDLSNPVYQRTKSLMTAFREANPQIRFVYLMGYHPEVRTQFFYVDSEPVTSSDYSPPGQLFADTRPEDIDHYLEGEPYTDGPYFDSWGEWVSGYVPLKNQRGDVIAMVGIDIATATWHNQITFTRTLIGISAFLAALLVAVVCYRVHRKQNEIDELSKENQKLSKERGTLKYMQKLAQLGSLTIHFPEGDVIVDEQFQRLFRSTRLPAEAFRSFIHLEDQDKYEDMIKEIKVSNIVYSWIDLRIGTQDAGFRNYHIYGNIERHASGSAEQFEGVMQDITDIEK